MRIPIASSSSQGRSIPLTAERLVNMYAEKAPSGAKSPVVVLGCPGLTRFCDIDVRRTRGLYRTPADGRLYAVVRNSLYYINSDGQATNLGTIDSSGRVGMADNGLQLCIVTGASGYTYSVTDGLQQITDDGFPGADTVTFLDGYFIFNNSTSGNRGQFFISDLLDGQVYDATDFATAESYPDNLIRVFADHSQLLLFGSETIEIWFNGGAADFPFVRAQGSVIEQGLGARWSVAKLDETVVWLDNEGIVRRLEGSTPVRISTHAIEYDISRGDWENASAWSYVEEGHQFYVLTVPARDLATQQAGTYVYDAATQLWHERKSYRQDYSRSGFYARAYGKHITADIDIGRLYEQRLDVYEEDGEHLVAEMQFPQIQNDGKRFKVHRLQLDVEAGSTDKPISSGHFLTSRPYPIVAVEGLHSSFEEIKPQPRYSIDSEALSGQFVSISGILRDLFREYTEYSPEAVGSSFVGISGQFKSIFKEYTDYEPEAVDSQFVSVAGTFNQILVPYEDYPEEALGSSFVSITGSFT